MAKTIHFIRFTLLAILLAVVIYAPPAAFAATPADYRSRVESARLEVEQLRQNLDSVNKDLERTTIAEIERNLPSAENVEWPGGSVETDNRWLYSKLQAFLAETERDARRLILTEISERLLSISETAGEIATVEASEQSKDRDKQKLAEILAREEFQKPKAAEESLFAKWWRQFLEWLERAFPQPETVPNKPSGLGSLQFWLQIVIYVLVIGLIGFLLYRFAPFLFERFKTRKQVANDERIILGERIADDAVAADLFHEAELLARNGDLRAAIRKGYIALLCDLSDRKIVRLARHKTNRDYLRDVRKDDGLFENVNGMTRSFENNWYGLRRAELSDWEDFRSMYMRTRKRA